MNMATNPSGAASAITTPDELLARARTLAPVLRERAAKASLLPKRGGWARARVGRAAAHRHVVRRERQLAPARERRVIASIGAPAR